MVGGTGAEFQDAKIPSPEVRIERERPHEVLVNSGVGVSDVALLATSDGRLQSR